MAVRVVLAQIGASLLVAALFWLQGSRSALAALCGGLAVALGTAVLASRMFAKQGVGGGLAWMRLLVGTALKWAIAIGALYLALARWQLPALPLLVAYIVVLLVNLFAFRFTS
jgi:F0F1-type ATP synthase assembly protein I